MGKFFLVIIAISVAILLANERLCHQPVTANWRAAASKMDIMFIVVSDLVDCLHPSIVAAFMCSQGAGTANRNRA
jgi:hypothetical protein